MNPHIQIGAERELFPNPYLSRLDEHSCTVETWGIASSDAFRFSFLCVDAFERNCSLPAAITVADLANPRLKIVVGWVYHHHGSLRIRSRFVESKLRQSGWEIVISEGLALASRRVHEHVKVTEVPNGCEHILQGFFIISGNEWSLSDLLKTPLLPSVRHFCLMQRLQPSYEFVNEICARNLSVAFQATVSDLREGTVVIGPESRAPNLNIAFSGVDISKVFWDAEAPKVWAGGFP